MRGIPIPANQPNPVRSSVLRLRPDRRRRVGFGVGVLILAAAAGVAVLDRDGGSTKPSAESLLAARTAPTLLQLDDRQLPIERYLLTDRQLAALTRAQVTLAATCVSRYGLAMPRLATDVGLQVNTNTSSSANTAHRYGISDAAVAARYGYHQPDSAATEPKRPPEPQISAAVDLVLSGDPTAPSEQRTEVPTGSRPTATYRGKPIPDGGCLAEAGHQLGVRSGILGDAPLADEVNMSSYTQTKREPATAKAIQAWSGCMRTAGFDYADPAQAPGRRFSGTTASQEEIAVATTDVACKRRTNLVGYWFTAEQAYQESAIRKHAAEFAQIRQEQQTKTTRATAVLAQPGFRR